MSLSASRATLRLASCRRRANTLSLTCLASCRRRANTLSLTCLAPPALRVWPSLQSFALLFPGRLFSGSLVKNKTPRKEGQN